MVSPDRSTKVVAAAATTLKTKDMAFTKGEKEGILCCETQRKAVEESRTIVRHSPTSDPSFKMTGERLVSWHEVLWPLFTHVMLR